MQQHNNIETDNDIDNDYDEDNIGNYIVLIKY